uniref:Uncharacterized protein n=1 Tax=Glossina palpalis gambiensis TaxID=67801 RepID=A0A1B0B9T3_9MUSC
MYSVVAQSKRICNETGIALRESFLSSHSSDVLKFLFYVKTFCLQNKIRWQGLHAFCCDRVVSVDIFIKQPMLPAMHCFEIKQFFQRIRNPLRTFASKLEDKITERHLRLFQRNLLLDYGEEI